MRHIKIMIATLCLVLFTGLMAGCSLGSKDTTDNTRTTLKVMHYDERSFYQQYGMLFSSLYPNIDIEVVSTQNVNYEEGKDMQKAMQDFIDEQKPDVIMINGIDEYARMASEGKLYNLESFIKKDKFDLEGIIPGIIDYIKERSDGVLYGLAPNFYSQAIFYNKDLFTKHGVPFPEDRMSWEQLLQLAARFPTTGEKDDRVYGLKAGYQTDLYYFALSIGTSQDLTYINPTTMQLTINSDSWKKVFETADNAIKSGTLYSDDRFNMNSGESTSYEDYLLRDPFIGGKLAMTMDGNYLMDQINEAQKRLKDKGIQNWDLVTMPVNPQKPDESTGMSVYQIFAIDANSANAEAAWKFISYINGDNFARVTSKLQNGNFPVRAKYLDEVDKGHNMAAFYSLKPAQNNMYKDYDKLPQQFMMKFDGLMREEMQKITDGTATVSEALDSLQVKGQQLLTEESKNDAKPEPSTSGSSTEASSSVSVSAN